MEEEKFTCCECKKEFSEEDGTWPVSDMRGNAVYQISALHNEFYLNKGEFTCYDCLE